MRLKALREFFALKDWICRNAKFTCEESVDAWMEAAYLAQYGRYGVIEPSGPLAFVAGGKARWYAVMIGWPISEFVKAQKFPKKDPKGKTFYIHFLHTSKKNMNSAMREFDKDIQVICPDVEKIIVRSKGGIREFDLAPVEA